MFSVNHRLIETMSLFSVLGSRWGLDLRTFSCHAYLIKRLPNIFHAVDYEMHLCFMTVTTSWYSYANSDNKRQLQEGQYPLF